MKDWNLSLLNILFDTDMQKQLLSLRIEKDWKLSQFMSLSQSKKDNTEKIIKFNFQWIVKHLISKAPRCQLPKSSFGSVK